MTQEQIIKELESLIDEGNRDVLSTKWESAGCMKMVKKGPYDGWRIKTLAFLKMILPNDSEYIKAISDEEKNYLRNAESCVSIISNLVDHINKGIIDPVSTNSNKVNADAEIKRIFSRFHRVARQIRSRHSNRATLEVNDEYDVQDLLHALLKLFFDDIRAEEWTPSYAGKSARMDFLLKNEGLVIEVKKTRQGLTDKEVGDQLIIDVDRYKAHPDCKKLICFVYDPEGRIGNPEGLIKDLNGQHKGFAEVIIEPNM